MPLKLKQIQSGAATNFMKTKPKVIIKFELWHLISCVIIALMIYSVGILILKALNLI